MTSPRTLTALSAIAGIGSGAFVWLGLAFVAGCMATVAALGVAMALVVRS